MRTALPWERKPDASIASQRRLAFLVVRVGGFRHYATNKFARNDPLRIVLFCAVCCRGDRGGLADVFRSPLKLVVVALPDHCIEAMTLHKIEPQIKRYGIRVCFGDGQGQGVESTLAQIRLTRMQQRGCDSRPTRRLLDAKLSDVRHVFGDARAQNKPNSMSVTVVEGDERCGFVKMSAARETDDIMKEARGAGDGSILIVDKAVEMAFVCGCDERAGGGEVVITPSVDGNASGGRDGRLGPREIELEEEPTENLKSMPLKDLAV